LKNFAPIVFVVCLIAATGVAASAADPALLHRGTAHDALFDIAFDGNFGMAVGSAGTILTSDNGGSSWVHGTRPDTDLALLGVAVEGTRRFVIGQSGQIFRLSNSNWQALDSGTDARLFAVALGRRDLVVAAGAFGTILVSNDEGSTWSKVDLDWMDILDDYVEPHLYAAQIDGDVITVGGEFGLMLRSVDRGATWEVTHKGEASIFDFVIGSDGKGLAVGQNGVLLRTSDGGRRWSAEQRFGETSLLGIWRSGDRAVAVGMRGGFASADGGHTWNAITTGDIDTGWYQAVASPDGRNRPVMAGHRGRILEIGD
jgi:photosystem II stability/assembly factor-like uncharacterized protein